MTNPKRIRPGEQGRRLARPLLLVMVAACSSAARSQALDCMIQPNQVVLVGSPVPGVVERIAVERGDMVARGQVVVQFGANVERAALAVARERATQVGEVVVASSAQELAKSELERANELYAQNFVSKTYLDKQLAEAKGAGGRSDQASERRRLASRELELAQAQLEQRTIRAPIGGVVVERLAAPGELIDQKPLLRLASVDPLRVDVLVPAAAFGQVEAGRKATVVPELFNRSSHTAVVKTVDRVIDAASNTFRVRLELPNPGGTLPAGLRCKVDLALQVPEANRTAPAAGAAPALADRPVAPLPTSLQPGAAALPARTSSIGPAMSATSAPLQR
jgi:RND family efflux transporter MFP subunit